MDLYSGNSTLATYIGDSLKEQIINLDLLPGTKLSEVKMSRMFNCSRTPVRDAFYQLRLKGYVESKPQSGTFVTRIDLARVEEVRFVRESVEIAVLRLGIENGSFTPKIPFLLANIGEMKMAYAQRNLKRFTELDLMFHQLLYASVGKEFVRKYVGEDDVHYTRLRFMVTRDNANIQRTIDEHAQICEVIKSGSPKNVNTIVEKHLRNIYNFLDSASPEYEKYFVNHV